jgi:diaminohydroxyphosphoribosylaminopyrimidine deaminase/5-amino-6-(5-phosphoribosylamino)uracil reductase
VIESARADADLRWLTEAIELSRKCPPSVTAFSVGAILVGADGQVLGTGYSRERDPVEHAEEAALSRAASGDLPAGALAAATMYSSLEPCAARASRPTPCADLIIGAGIRRVVIAWREPPIFVRGGGTARLRKAGVQVIVLPEVAAAARAVNAHLLLGRPRLRPRLLAALHGIMRERAAGGSTGVGPPGNTERRMEDDHESVRDRSERQGRPGGAGRPRRAPARGAGR